MHVLCISLGHWPLIIWCGSDFEIFLVGGRGRSILLTFSCSIIPHHQSQNKMFIARIWAGGGTCTYCSTTWLCLLVFAWFIKKIDSLHTYHRTPSNMCVFYLFCFASWQETFADAWDANGGENRNQYLFCSSSNIRFVLVFKWFIDVFWLLKKKIMDNHQNYLRFQFPPPWQETFADTGDGNGGGKEGPIFVPSITQYKLCMCFCMIHPWLFRCFLS